MTDIQEFGIAADAEEWINQLARRLRWRDREKVFAVLVSTLHALRDSLPVAAKAEELVRGPGTEAKHMLGVKLFGFARSKCIG